MNDEMTAKEASRYSIGLAIAGFLISGIGYWFDTVEAAGLLAVPLGLIVGYNACIAVHGDVGGVKGYAYAVGGVLLTTALQYALIT